MESGPRSAYVAGGGLTRLTCNSDLSGSFMCFVCRRSGVSKPINASSIVEGTLDRQEHPR
jgi:hypothetical protein